MLAIWAPKVGPPTFHSNSACYAQPMGGPSVVLSMLTTGWRLLMGCIWWAARG
ncbi:unnamed protein product [Ectocarpus sp. CCAP 1310/34]|nr:unnamed protein product [Ectocarpus sp. CCAP 1310/34]